jgi:hypothetical protein
MGSEQEFLHKLVQIKKLDEEVTRKVELTRLTVNTFCQDIAREVDISAETKIEKCNEQTTIDELNNERRKLLKQIKDYEVDCMTSVESTRSELLESVHKAGKWSDLMQQPSSLARLDTFKDVLNEQADSHLCYLEQLLLQVKAFQLGGKIMLFYESGQDKSVGSLSALTMKTPKIIESRLQLDFKNAMISGIFKFYCLFGSRKIEFAIISYFFLFRAISVVFRRSTKSS